MGVRLPGELGEEFSMMTVPPSNFVLSTEEGESATIIGIVQAKKLTLVLPTTWTGPLLVPSGESMMQSTGLVEFTGDAPALDVSDVHAKRAMPNV